MTEAAVSKIMSSDGSISKDASKDDILSALSAFKFKKEEAEKEDTTTATVEEVVVVKTAEEKKVEKAALKEKYVKERK